MSTDTDTDTDLAECDSCGEDVLVMDELRGDDAVGADVLCARCAGDGEGDE